MTAFAPKFKTLFCLAILNCSMGYSLTFGNSYLQTLDTIQTNEAKIDYISELLTRLIYVDPVKAATFAKIADSIAVQIDDPFYEIKRLSIKGISCFGNEEFDQAISAYLQALALLEQYDNPDFKAKTQNNLATTYQASGDINGCIEYFTKALSYFESQGDTLWMAHLNNNLAVQFLNNHEHSLADGHFYKSKLFYDHVGLPLYQGITALNFANLKIEMESYTAAKSLFLEAQMLVDTNTNMLLHAASNGGLAIIAKEQGSYSEAKALARLSIDQARKINHLEQEKVSLETLIDIHEKSGQFEYAVQIQKTLNAVNDSLFQQQQDQQLSDALKKYEIAEKEKQITILNSENEITALRLSNFKTALFFSLAGLVVFLSLLFYLIRLNRTIHKQNRLITKTLGEKDILLKEIHHRVKNNLQIISSLLDLQSRRTADDTAKSALTVGKNRVQSMALIHQNLYTEDDLTGISVKDYLTMLSSNLFEAYNVEEDNIQLQINVSNVVLDVDTMIPLGLIINELITNILKHAFVGRKDGTINIDLVEENSELRLTISDDGIGIPDTLDLKSGSFGYQLIHALAHQISGEISIELNKGTSVNLRIKNYKKVA